MAVILTLMDEDGSPITSFDSAFEVTTREVFGGEDTLTFSVRYPAPAELQPGTLVTVSDRIYRVQIIEVIESDDGELTVEVEAWARWYDLAKMPVAAPHDFVSATSTEVATHILAGTSWSLGGAAGLDRRDMSWDGGADRLDYLRTVARVYGVELEFNNIHRTVWLRWADWGTWRSVFFLRGKNLLSLTQNVDWTNVVHRVYPRGRDGLTIESVNAGVPWLEVPSHMVPPPSVELVANEFADAQALKDYAQDVLWGISSPRRHYRCKAIDIAALPGHEDQVVEVGDEVVINCEDTGVTDEWLRVVAITRHPGEPERTEIELATVEPTMAAANVPGFTRPDDLGAALDPPQLGTTPSQRTGGTGCTCNGGLIRERVFGSSHTLEAADVGRCVTMDSAASTEVIIPAHTAAALPVGTSILIHRRGTGSVQVIAASGVTLDSTGGRSRIRERYGFAALLKTAENRWSVSGDMSL